MNRREAARYFVHGLAFSLMFLVLAIVWVFLLIILVGIGFFIGLIIGLGLLFLIIGGLNSFITSLLWFEVKKRILGPAIAWSHFILRTIR
jgi:hypothetical protein